MINNIQLFLTGIRLRNIIIALVCCVIAVMKIDGFNHISAIFSIVAVMLLMIITNLSNDILDIKTDTINRPDRPLITNPSIGIFFKIIVFMCSFLVLGVSFFINFWAQCIVVGSLPVLIFYSKLFKPVPLIGNIFVAFYLAFVFIFIEIAITNSVELMIAPAIFAFGISLIREIIKDIEDYNGDKANGIKTLPVIIGIKSCIYVAIFFIISFLFVCSLIMLHSFYFYCVMAVFFLVFMPLFYLIFFLIKSPTSESCGEASALIKKITILGLIIIYII